ncbi:25784_t:CDS:1, partial [Dentiscutata erythropus]
MQYVYLIKDFSNESHIAIFIVNEIKKVLLDIGVYKFEAVISDTTSA